MIATRAERKRPDWRAVTCAELGLAVTASLARGVILDKVLLQQVDIDPYGEVEVSIQDGAIVITPHRYASNDAARAAFRKIAKARSHVMKRLSK